MKNSPIRSRSIRTRLTRAIRSARIGPPPRVGPEEPEAAGDDPDREQDDQRREHQRDPPAAGKVVDPRRNQACGVITERRESDPAPATSGRTTRRGPPGRSPRSRPGHRPAPRSGRSPTIRSAIPLAAIAGEVSGRHRERVAPGGPHQERRADDDHPHRHDAPSRCYEDLPDEDVARRDRRREDPRQRPGPTFREQPDHAELRREEEEHHRHRGGVVGRGVAVRLSVAPCSTSRPVRMAARLGDERLRRGRIRRRPPTRRPRSRSPAGSPSTSLAKPSRTDSEHQRRKDRDLAADHGERCLLSGRNGVGEAGRDDQRRADGIVLDLRARSASVAAVETSATPASRIPASGPSMIAGRASRGRGRRPRTRCGRPPGRRRRASPKEEREPERRDDRHQDRRPVADPLAEVLDRDRERGVHRSVPEGLAGQVEEDGLEVGLDHLHAPDRRARLGRRLEEAREEVAGVLDDQLEVAVAPPSPSRPAGAPRAPSPRARGSRTPPAGPGPSRRRGSPARGASLRRGSRPASMIPIRSQRRSASSM